MSGGGVHFLVASASVSFPRLPLSQHRAVVPQAVYELYPELLEWVAGTPDNATLELFAYYAQQLGCYISDEAPREAVLDSAGLPVRWLATREALNILSEVDKVRVGLLAASSPLPTKLRRDPCGDRQHPAAQVSSRRMEGGGVLGLWGAKQMGSCVWHPSACIVVIAHWICWWCSEGVERRGWHLSLGYAGHRWI
jgi:hypothetical protein